MCGLTFGHSLTAPLHELHRHVIPHLALLNQHERAAFDYMRRIVVHAFLRPGRGHNAEMCITNLMRDEGPTWATARKKSNFRWGKSFDVLPAIYLSKFSEVMAHGREHHRIW